MLVSKQSVSDVDRPSRLYGWLEAAVLLSAFLIQAPLILNADLGWLLTVCEKILAGQRLYTDVIELNPPLSVYIYLPAAFLGQTFGVGGHLFVILMIIGLAWIALPVVCRLLGIHDLAALKRARCLLLFCLLILPNGTFGQREHIAVVLLVPFVALAAAAANDRAALGMGLRIGIGLAAGIAMCIKPHFALICGLPLLWNVLRQRSLRPALGVEVWAASSFVLSFIAWAYLTYPQFFDTFVKWTTTVYVPMRAPLFYFFNAKVLYLLTWWAVMLWIARGFDRSNWQGAPAWILAAVGAYLSYVIQGKNFSYTRVPAVEFAVLSVLLAPAVLRWRLPNAWMRPVQATVLSIGILQFAGWLMPFNNSHAYLRKPLEEIGPPNPRLVAITSNVGIGEPLTHKMGATWVSGLGAQLLSGSAAWMIENKKLPPSDRHIADEIFAFDRGMLRRDLVVGKPDIILIDNEALGIDFDWEAWARTDPVISAELDRNYSFRRKVKDIEIWARKVRGSQPAPATRR